MSGASHPRRLAFRQSFSIAERTVQRLEVIPISTQGDRRENPWGNLKTLEWLTVALKDPSTTLSIAQTAIALLLTRSSARVITNSSRHRPCFLQILRTITTKKCSWRKRRSRSDLLSLALRAVNTTDFRSSQMPAIITSRFSRKRPGRACVPSRLSTRPSLIKLYRAVRTNYRPSRTPWSTKSEAKRALKITMDYSIWAYLRTERSKIRTKKDLVGPLI